MTRPRKYEIQDRWSAAFDRYGFGGTLWAPVAHLWEDQAGWEALVAAGHYRKVTTTSGRTYYTTRHAHTRLRARHGRPVPASALDRVTGPLPRGAENDRCDLWCGAAAAQILNGFILCSSHVQSLQSLTSEGESR